MEILEDGKGKRTVIIHGRDIIALVLIICCTALILSGRDTVIGGILSLVAIAYFGQEGIRNAVNLRKRRKG